MCGIAGEVRFDGGVSEAPLAAMSAAIRHRGPDDEGAWLESRRRCGLVFRRLAIIDLSPLGHQPMHDPETGNVIVFNGEIYNFQKLRRDCEAAGAQFRSRSDTEVILALYRRLGPACVRELRGMFALAIWDARKSELFLARDRFGKKPLHYARTPNGLAFCSEIDPLSRHPDVPREHDTEALELYLQFLHVPAPWTIYRSIRKLPPAHWAIVSQSGLRVERYWELDYRRKLAVTEGEALEGFEEKFTEAVRLRMISDVPLGALLSGGVDSSAVVAAMARLSATPVRTFSVGFDDEKYNELPHAAEVATVCGTDHHAQIVAGDVESVLHKMVPRYGEPFADPSAIPSFIVSETARQNVTVALNGDGGDELLGGYPRYWLSPWTMLSSRLLGPVVPAERLVGITANRPPGPALASRVASRIVRDFVHPELGSLVNFRDNWHDGIRRDLLRGASGVVPAWRRTWLNEAAAHASNPVDAMLYFDTHTWLPGDLLVKMDTASMHCALEARSPLLDHELAEYCAALPVRFKVRNRQGKYLLKRLAAKSFGETFVKRPKQGFGIPLKQWLRSRLRPLLREVLSSRDLMAPFEQVLVRRMMEDFLSERPGRDDAARLWGLMMYGLWRQSACHSRESGDADASGLKGRTTVSACS